MLESLTAAWALWEKHACNMPSPDLDPRWIAAWCTGEVPAGYSALDIPISVPRLWNRGSPSSAGESGLVQGRASPNEADGLRYFTWDVRLIS